MRANLCTTFEIMNLSKYILTRKFQPTEKATGTME